MVRPRVGVRGEQLRHRGTPQDRPDPALVFVSDGVQDQALARVETQPEPPPLPADLPAAHLETRALWLDDLQRLKIIPQRPHAVSSIGPGTGRQRDHTQILYP